MKAEIRRICHKDSQTERAENFLRYTLCVCGNICLLATIIDKKNFKSQILPLCSASEHSLFLLQTIIVFRLSSPKFFAI